MTEGRNIAMEASGRPDIIVVGGGAAGCVVARRLVESTDASILLLEAGPDLRRDTPADHHDAWRLPTPPDWGLESEPNATGASTKLRRGRLLGGTSWFTRFAVRGAPADFDGWAEAGSPGWGFDDVLPAFRRIEADAEFGRDPWHGDLGPVPITRYPDLPRSPIHEAALEALTALGIPTVDDHNRPGATGVGPMPMNSRDGTRVTTADAYLAPDGQLADLAIRPDCEVDRLVMDAGRVTGVRLVDGTVIAADRVVLAAGTYGSPTILMRSGIGPAEHLAAVGVTVQVDLPGVGSNLADHPGVDLDSGWRGRGATGPVLHSIATLRTSSSPSAAPDLMYWVSDPTGDDPRLYFDPILLKPIARGTVRLRSATPGDPPRIKLPDPSEPADVDRLVDGYLRGIELANRPEVQRHTSGKAPTDPGTHDARRRIVLENAYSIPHVVGTCRMGPSADHGDVVDAVGRVHGVAGLMVADASVIPDAPSGFPHIIAIMLAEHLTSRWSGECGV